MSGSISIHENLETKGLEYRSVITLYWPPSQCSPLAWAVSVFPWTLSPIDAWILLTWYRSDCVENICTCNQDILDSRWKEFLASVASPEPKNQLSWLALLFSFYVNIYGMFYHVCVQHMWVGTHQGQRHWVVVSHLVEVLGLLKAIRALNPSVQHRPLIVRQGLTKPRLASSLPGNWGWPWTCFHLLMLCFVWGCEFFRSMCFEAVSHVTQAILKLIM